MKRIGSVECSARTVESNHEAFTFLFIKQASLKIKFNSIFQQELHLMILKNLTITVCKLFGLEKANFKNLCIKAKRIFLWIISPLNYFKRCSLNWLWRLICINKNVNTSDVCENCWKTGKILQCARAFINFIWRIFSAKQLSQVYTPFRHRFLQ